MSQYLFCADSLSSSTISGNLATKSLTPIVKPSILVQDSEYLETHLIVVPNVSRKEFLREYETLAPMVVPRSAIQVAEDEEYALFSVTTFKKYSTEFLQKCREQKWTPRQYKYIEGGKEEEQRELQRVAREEKKVWSEALWLARTSWSESIMIWMHALTLRVFVETVLRYGLPLDFVSVLIKVQSDFQTWTELPTPFKRRSSISPLFLPYFRANNQFFTHRHRPKRSAKSRHHLTLHTPISVAMHLAGTRRAKLLKTTHQCLLTWQRPVLGSEMAMSTRHTFTTSSNSPEQCSIDSLLRLFRWRAIRPRPWPLRWSSCLVPIPTLQTSAHLLLPGLLIIWFYIYYFL